tara:strand:- start:1910 stop:3067 length:1158 start_codon:yes stop_codon:yes gene_type:complete
VIKRNAIKDVLELISFFPVTGLLGARQVGKTTFAKDLISLIDKECIYLDLEYPDDLAKINEPSLFFKQNEDKCIIIDEVQRMPSLFPILRAVVDQKREPTRFILLGSASPDLIRDSSESLAGRIAYREISTLNFIEIEELQSMDYHWVNGGFPEVFLSKKEKFKALWYQNFIQTYIEKDLPQLGLKVDSLLLRNFLMMLAHNNGNIWNASTIAKSLGVTSPTVQKYLSFLENSFMITVLPSFHINVKKRIVKAPKIYYRDTGILHYLHKTTTIEALQGHPIIGSSWEAYVIEQIKQLAQNKYDFYFYRTHRGAECDLLLADGTTVVYSIEVKYSSAPKVTKGYINAIDDVNAKQNFMITPSSDDYLIKENIRVCSLKAFIKNYLK